MTTSIYSDNPLLGLV